MLPVATLRKCSLEASVWPATNVTRITTSVTSGPAAAIFELGAGALWRAVGPGNAAQRPEFDARDLQTIALGDEGMSQLVQDQ